MQAALLIVVVIVTLIGGRVMPMFTRNGAGSEPRVNGKLDKAALALLVTGGLCWLFGAWAPLTALAAALAGCAHLVRLLGWQPQSTLRHPLLWILHLSYSWIGFGLLLLAAAALGKVSASTAFHAIGVGAISGMIIGMMTRTSLGHTGRMLKAGCSESMMFVLVQLGAASRLCANLVSYDARQVALLFSTLCWSCGFLLFLWVYGPYLTKARLDGREG
jgi:uncharacterized protein involved in response to NO